MQVVLIFGFVLTERRQPAVTLAWIMAVAFLPVLGALLFLFLGRRRMNRHSAQHERVCNEVSRALDKAGLLVGFESRETLQSMESRTAVMVRLGSKVATLPAISGNRCELLINGPTAYREMFQAIRAARHHVHVQFYIIKADKMGMSLRDRLVERAQAGVAVRVLTDGVGSFGLPDDFWQPCLLYTSPSPRDKRQSRMPSSA